MEYDLSRIDYTICGVTYPDTLKILPPPDSKIQQKVSVRIKSEMVYLATNSWFYKFIAVCYRRQKWSSTMFKYKRRRSSCPV